MCVNVAMSRPTHRLVAMLDDANPCAVLHCPASPIQSVSRLSSACQCPLVEVLSLPMHSSSQGTLLYQEELVA